MTQQLYDDRRLALLAYYKKHQCLPSYDKTKDIFGLKSKNSAYRYVEKFIEDGLLGKADDGRLIPTHKLYELRVLGTVQAGFPTDVDEEDADTISLDNFLVQNPVTTYMLTVNGDSMIDAGILEGDMVIVDRSKKPQNNDIVVARVGSDWTMKYFIHRGHNKFVLRPANKAYKDIHPEDETQIGGVVTSIIRRYS